jgi:hypothetical protein
MRTQTWSYDSCSGIMHQVTLVVIQFEKWNYNSKRFISKLINKWCCHVTNLESV